MNARRLGVLALTFLGLIAPRPLEAGQAIEVSLNNKVPKGTRPSLVVTVHQDLRALHLQLQPSEGAAFEERIGNLARGSRRTIELPQQAGRVRYHGTLTATFPGGEEGAMPLEFEAEVIASLGLAVQRDELDLTNRALRLRAARPLVKVDYLVFSDSGAVLDRGSKGLSPASTDVRLAWGGAAGEVLKIQLVATDQDGIHEDLELAPWSYAIPHEEVEFETGKWEIRPEQAPKLDRSFTLLAAGLAKYGKLLAVKLYVAGYTDTVSTPDFNQQLSEQRALAIARYLRARGFGHPIYYLGLGERALKVPTADEVDEPRNRRAEYVLAAEPPAMGVGASSLWKKLP